MMKRNSKKNGNISISVPVKNHADDAEAFVVIGPESEFYATEGGLLGLRHGGEDKGRVSAYRMFPSTRVDTYISITDKEKKEIGVILDMAALREVERSLVCAELDRRYFIPEIVRFVDIKEEFNYTFFKTQTDAGYREFTVFDMNTSILNLGSQRVILSDIDGNKYLVRELDKKGKKALKFLEIWL